MCILSGVGDYFRDNMGDRHPWVNPTLPAYPIPGVTEEQFNELKKEVQELKKLLKAAKEFDEATGQPDCSNEDKVALIKKIAELVGVDLSEIFDE